MKKLFYIICILFAVGIVSCNSCNDNASVPIMTYVYVPVKDTIGDKDNMLRIVELEHQLTMARDSLKLMQDTFGADLFVAKYKLARIQRYVNISKKGKNSKYLRGWVQRALDE